MNANVTRGSQPKSRSIVTNQPTKPTSETVEDVTASCVPHYSIFQGIPLSWGDTIDGDSIGERWPPSWLSHSSSSLHSIGANHTDSTQLNDVALPKSDVEAYLGKIESKVSSLATKLDNLDMINVMETSTSILPGTEITKTSSSMKPSRRNARNHDSDVSKRLNERISTIEGRQKTIQSQVAQLANAMGLHTSDWNEKKKRLKNLMEVDDKSENKHFATPDTSQQSQPQYGTNLECGLVMLSQRVDAMTQWVTQYMANYTNNLTFLMGRIEVLQEQVDDMQRQQAQAYHTTSIPKEHKDKKLGVMDTKKKSIEEEGKPEVRRI